MKSALCWIRRDLRLDDHTALWRATRDAERTAVVFVYDRAILDRLEDRDDRRVTFIHRSLAEVARDLEAQGSVLLTLDGDASVCIPALAARLGVDTVVAAHDDDPYAVERDAAVARALAAQGCAFTTVKDHVVFERQEVLTSQGRPFRVFTPYCRAWRERLTEADLASRDPDFARLWPASGLSRLTGPDLVPRSLESIGFREGRLWLGPGSRAGQRRLADFAARLAGYSTARDFPALEGTSGLSVHLRHGTVSVRACFREAQRHSAEGARKWAEELVWREFFHMVLSNDPQVASRPFRPEFDGVEWPGDAAHAEAWCAGATGYPFVDAAMRCLKETGWMHNRLRMVTAMFFTKDLLLDYRTGEAWFARHLLDYELANNNGGWQWSASTGVDAQPWFRLFNHVLQGRRFDPDGAFVKTWCPELRGFEGAAVHEPCAASQAEQTAAGCVVGRDYPLPIVDHAAQRARALAFLEGVLR